MRRKMLSIPLLSAKQLQNLTIITLTLAILLASSATSQPQAPPKPGFRVDLHHVDAHQNLSPWELIMRAISRGKERMRRLTPPSDEYKSFGSQILAGNGEYYMQLTIGTPGVPFSAIMDTGSDLIWTQCQPCINCFPQRTPVFDPSKSSTFSNVPCKSVFCKEMTQKYCSKEGNCQYYYGYGDQSTTKGYVGKDTFTFGMPGGEAVSVPGIGFGCGVDNDGRGLNHGTGLVGLGRGHLSLVSQLGYNKFAYCLTDISSNKTSSIIFGSLADSNFTLPRKETPLISNPSRPSQYHLSLMGITVGDRSLPVDKSLIELGSDGTGGMMLDSGTTISYLTNKTFNDVKEAFIAQMKLKPSRKSYSGLELCFKVPPGIAVLDAGFRSCGDPREHSAAKHDGHSRS